MVNWQTPTLSAYWMSTSQKMDEISAHYWRNSVSFPWRQGDILMLDNMLVAHARNPYVGPRKIVVGMGSMLGVDQLPGGSGA